MGRRKKREAPEEDEPLDLTPHSTREVKQRHKVDDLIRDTGHWEIWIRKGEKEPWWKHTISKVICRQREVLMREGLSDEEPVRTAD